MLSLLAIVVAIVCFALTALDVANLIAWGLVAFAVAHLPLDGISFPSRS